MSAHSLLGFAAVARGERPPRDGIEAAFQVLHRTRERARGRKHPPFETLFLWNPHTRLLTEIHDPFESNHRAESARIPAHLSLQWEGMLRALADEKSRDRLAAPRPQRFFRLNFTLSLPLLPGQTSIDVFDDESAAVSHTPDLSSPCSFAP